ncbi:hypothetical protein HHI36_015737, partial [Cryptolaemus montrouzieri]
YLLDGYTDRRTQAQWQLELHSCKQNANEGVISFANRVENCYIKLLGTLDDTLDDERRNIHTEMLQTQALNVFLMGLNREVAMIVKARNPNTLEESIRLALSEEQELKSRLEIARYQNVGNSNSRFCTNCNRNGHTSFNCRSQNQGRKNFSQPQSFTNNQFQKQNIRQIGNNAYVNKKICNYCKNVGHLIHECRKRQYNNKWKNDHRPNAVSANTTFNNSQRQSSVATINDPGCSSKQSFSTNSRVPRTETATARNANIVQAEFQH